MNNKEEVMISEKRYKCAVCADGYSVSIQAHKTGYCTPRNNEGPFTEVELGFPSASDELILPWAEDRLDPTGTVYAYVPSEVVLELLLKHGGLVGGNIPPMVVGYSSNFPNESR